MPALVVSLFLVFVVIAFGVRSWWQWRTTGSTGFVGVRRDAGGLERVAAFAMVVAFAGVPVAVWIGTPVFGSAVAWTGVAIAVLGIAGTFVAQTTMREAWRIGVDPDARTRLVTGGLFAWVRNPIFSLMIAAHVGLALACSTPAALVLPVVLVAALEVQIRLVEEPYLQRVHGDAFRAWARRTGRLVPGIGRIQ